MDFNLSGQIVDVVGGRVFGGTVHVRDGRIAAIIPGPAASNRVILPGLIDAHIHIESSMLVPSEFARLALVHGTVGAVCDPHEIANVLGLAGVNFMVESGKSSPLHFFFGAPSCVPATDFESAGALLDARAVRELLARPDTFFLSEMMNFPGVLHRAPDVMDKISAAREFNKVIDGHAPGLKGEALASYLAAGISTDHECTTIQEARVKASLGMKISIREGSAAKNFDDLIPIIKEYPELVMFCSDDKHPDDLVSGHINSLVKRALTAGYDPITVLRAACYTPVKHYGLPVGLLREGDAADCIVVDSLAAFNVLETYCRGLKVAEQGKCLIKAAPTQEPNQFHAKPIKESSLAVQSKGTRMRVIGVLEDQLVTREIDVSVTAVGGVVQSDTASDVLKLVVMNRYRPDAQPAIGFVHGFGLKRGALASSIAHDSHNLIAVGVEDEDIARAMNLVIASKGGIAVVSGDGEEMLPLPVAGLMSNADGYEVAGQYRRLNAAALKLGARLKAPFMTLSFLALLVIPKLKLSDRGLFDGERFEFVPLFSS